MNKQQLQNQAQALRRALFERASFAITEQEAEVLTRSMHRIHVPPILRTVILIGAPLFSVFMIFTDWPLLVEVLIGVGVITAQAVVLILAKRELDAIRKFGTTFTEERLEEIGKAMKKLSEAYEH